jgi:hydroxymethylglutaryl-CoA reductase
MSIPLQVGVVGGATKVHPFAKLALNLMEVKSKDDLQRIIAVSGLLQNFSALRALVSEGIIAGHMKMHLDNISGELTKDPSTHKKLVNLLQERLKRNKKVSLSDGKELLQNLLSKA